MKLIIIFSLLFSANIVFCQTVTDSVDIELLEVDIEDVKSNYYGELNIPLSIGAFPVKNYPGSGGIVDIEVNLLTKKLIGGSFSIGKSLEAKKLLHFKKSHEVFCNIVVLSDFYDDTNYTHSSNLISSRNHPNYLGIGTVKTNSQNIDYITFIEIEDESLNSYAIISGKLFNLKNGNTIIVVPLKDYSLRFKQINLKIDDYTKINENLKFELSKDANREFINSENSIE